MKNLIKIIATITALSTMTACGASGLVDDLSKLINEGLNSLENLRLEAAARQIRTEELAEFRENLDTNLSDQQREDMVVAEATRLANLSGTEKAEFDAKIQTRVNYLAEVAGLTASQRAANLDRCQADATGDGCAVVLLTFCDDTPFDNFCFSDPAYDDRRVEICEVDSVRNNCEDTISRVCAANPFITLCAGDDRYNKVRAARCVAEKASPRCEATVKRVCDLDVEDSLCDLIPAYTSQRLTLDDTVQEIISRDCANIRGDSRCARIVAFVCERQPLNAVCDDLGLYSAARRTACLTNTERDDCKTTVSQVCSANSLDDLCVGIDAYASLQELACRGESATSKPECAATLTLVCGNLAGTSATGDPFGTVCSNAVFQPARAAITLACASDASGRLCVSQRNEICGDTPFNPVCKRSEYLYLQIRACIGKDATGNCADNTFFTDPVILGCLTDPFHADCTNNNSAFKPYETDALDATCLLDGARTGCANPTAVFGTTLPTTLVQVLTDTSEPYDATTNPYTGGVIADPTMPHHISTNPYISGFITIDADDLDENGNLIPPGVEGSNFQFVTTGGITHNVLGLNVRGGGAGPEFPNPIPGGAVTMRRGGAGSDNDDGVAYFSTTSSPDEAPAVSYGGILPTTNLGAPLLPQPAVEGNNVTAIWDGHVSYRQNPFTQNRVTNFYVDFTAGTINFANTAGDGATSVGAKVKSSVTRLRLNGKFGEAHGLALGQLGGTVEYVFGLISQVTPGPDAVPNESSFQLHGLIGQEGAVGVFTNPLARTGNSLIGGFTASNPDHPNNQ